MRVLAEVSLIFGPDLADICPRVLAADQKVAGRFDGKFNPRSVINNDVLGLVPPSPLSGVKRV